jgi:hypothetical protein
MTHQHSFKNWTFAVPVETATFTTIPVLERRLPIVDVYHHENGDWQFLCGTTVEEDDIKLVCLGCIVENDATILELADLPGSWRAHRASADSPWLREWFDDSDDGGV